MYSKDRGFTASPVGAQRPSRTPRVSVPPNYSGHAIVDGEERPLGVMREEAVGAEERSDGPTPRFDGLPRVSELGGGMRTASRALSAPFTVAESSAAPDEGASREGSETRLSAPPRPVEEGSSPTGSHGLLSGVGLGAEELLLLGLILFLLRENDRGGEGGCDRGDLDETVILLGLLLLLG